MSLRNARSGYRAYAWLAACAVLWVGLTLQLLRFYRHKEATASTFAPPTTVSGSVAACGALAAVVFAVLFVIVGRRPRTSGIVLAIMQTVTPALLVGTFTGLTMAAEAARAGSLARPTQWVEWPITHGLLFLYLAWPALLAAAAVGLTLDAFVSRDAGYSYRRSTP